MRQKLRIHQTLRVGIVMLLAVVLCPVRALAATGSITLDLTNTTDKADATIGGEIDAYLVGTFNRATGRYVLTDVFEGSETAQRIASMDPADLDANNESIATGLEDDIANGDITLPEDPDGMSEIVDSRAVVTGLEEGLYLVMHWNENLSDEDLVMNSFLISIPYNGELDVRAAPKLGFSTTDIPSKPVNPGEDPGLGTGTTDGKLDVSKVVVSTRESDKELEFGFRVVLTNQTQLTGTRGDMEFVNGVADFSLRDGETAHAEGLPAGTEYEVWETESHSLMPEAEMTTADDGTPVETFTNTYTPDTTTGTTDDSLEVTKTVVSTRDEDMQRAYGFTVTLWGSTLSGTYGEGDTAMTFTDGVATFTLHDGEVRKATGLPEGTRYQVEETDAGGLVSTFESSEDGASVAFTNTYAPDTTTGQTDGDLRVKKVVDSPREEDSEREYGFRVTIWNTSQSFAGEHDEYGTTFTDGVAEFTLRANEVWEAKGLPEGTKYEVEETDTGGLEPSYEMSDDDTKVTFTNTYEPETETGTTEVDLTVSKVVKSSKDADKQQAYGFRVTIRNDSESFEGEHEYGDMTFTDGVAEFTLSDGESCKATGLPEQTSYTVKEIDAKGLVPTHEKSADESVVTFTNTPEDEVATTTTTTTATTPSSTKSTSVGLRVPTTGDNSLPFIGIAVAGVIAVGIGVFLSKRKRHKD